VLQIIHVTLLRYIRLVVDAFLVHLSFSLSIFDRNTILKNMKKQHYILLIKEVDYNQSNIRYYFIFNYFTIALFFA